MRFQDRRQAGRMLSYRLDPREHPNPLVVALSPEGVPVAAEVARWLSAPLGLLNLNQPPIPPLSEDFQPLEDGFERARVEGSGPQGGRRELALKGKEVILVDDGVTTGAMAVSAEDFLTEKGARSVVLATPVCTASTQEVIRSGFDAVICLETPEDVPDVNAFYEDNHPVGNDEIDRLLGQSGSRWQVNGSHVSMRIELPMGMAGRLELPPTANRLVIFASTGARGIPDTLDPMIAHGLNQKGIGTLLLDLPEPVRSQDPLLVADITLLSESLNQAVDWTRNFEKTAFLPLGLFGTGIGAAAALTAAANEKNRVSAIACLEGRPDLAIDRLPEVEAPTRFIVAQGDPVQLKANELARGQMPAADLITFPDVDHFLGNPDALRWAIESASGWFLHYLRPAQAKAA